MRLDKECERRPRRQPRLVRTLTAVREDGHPGLRPGSRPEVSFRTPFRCSPGELTVATVPSRSSSDPATVPRHTVARSRRQLPAPFLAPLPRSRRSSLGAEFRRTSATAGSSRALVEAICPAGLSAQRIVCGRICLVWNGAYRGMSGQALGCASDLQCRRRFLHIHFPGYQLLGGPVTRDRA